MIAFIIDEYRRTGQKQLLLERMQDEDSGDIYRVTLVRRFPTLDAAGEFFLREIPEARRSAHGLVLDDYAAKHRIKTRQKRPRRKKPKPQGEDKP